MSGKAFLLEDTYPVESILKRPGVYVAPSTSPSFGVLHALAVTGAARWRGQTELEDGRAAVAVEVSGRGAFKPNEGEEETSITIGSDYFDSALRDYTNWPEKHVREAVQNAVDAGATRVAIQFKYFDADMNPLPDDAVDYAFVELSYDDNGSGMSRDVLVNKFLSLGGSGKRTTTGSVGGFGKAKELLILPWARWSIETQEVVAAGHGVRYSIKAGTNRQGLRLTVLMRGDKCVTPSHAINFLKKCYLPNVRFTVQGQRVDANLRVGDLLTTLPTKNPANYGEVYYNKKSKFDAPALFVRVRGLFMHERYLAAGVPGLVIVELFGSTLDLLTANRDSVQWSLAYPLDQFVNVLAADTKSALRPKRNVVREKYTGEMFRSEADRREKTAYVQSSVMVAIDDMDAPSLGENVVEKIKENLEAAGGTSEDETDEDVAIDLRPQGEAIAPMLGIRFRGAAHVIAATRVLAWTPSFYIWNETEDFHVPAKFRPEKMPPTLRKLAKFWAELCRFVLIQLGHSGEYGVGWMFDRETGAACLSEDDERWLLLNPFKNANLGGDMYSLSEKDDVNLLYALAVHECTHLADALSQHDEAFAAALTMNIARTANMGATVNKIRAAVVARGPSGKRATEPEAAAPTKKGRATKGKRASGPTMVGFSVDALEELLKRAYGEAGGVRSASDLNDAVLWAMRIMENPVGTSGWRHAINGDLDLAWALKPIGGGRTDVKRSIEDSAWFDWRYEPKTPVRWTLPGQKPGYNEVVYDPASNTFAIQFDPGGAAKPEQEPAVPPVKDGTEEMVDVPSYAAVRRVLSDMAKFLGHDDFGGEELDRATAQLRMKLEQVVSWNQDQVGGKGGRFESVKQLEWSILPDILPSWFGVAVYISDTGEYAWIDPVHAYETYRGKVIKYDEPENRFVIAMRPDE